MKRSAKVTAIATSLFLVCLSSSIFLLHGLDEVRSGATLKEFLYLSSPKLVKRLSLGYEGLLADIYWTRAVQYYGGTHHTGGGAYELLWPLLNITTQLDPHILPAYDYGATFLTERPPDGAGMPDKAVELMEYGIKNNPANWRLYYNLGFIYYSDLKDYAKAADAFARGSEQPNAHPFLKILAAQAAQHGGEAQTAQTLWGTVYETTHDKYIRENALWHLRALKADQDASELEHLAKAYREKFGRFPDSFRQLASAGYLRGIPVDPTGNPYEINSDGKVYVSDPEHFPFVQHALPPGYVPSSFPRIPSSK